VLVEASTELERPTIVDVTRVIIVVKARTTSDRGVRGLIEEQSVFFFRGERRGCDSLGKDIK